MLWVTASCWVFKTMLCPKKKSKIDFLLPVALLLTLFNPLFFFSFPLSYRLRHGESRGGSDRHCCESPTLKDLCLLPPLAPSPSLGAQQQLPKTLSELWPQRCGTRAAKIESVFVCKCAWRRVNSLKVKGKNTN